jgi:hypothetical protein
MRMRRCCLATSGIVTLAVASAWSAGCGNNSGRRATPGAWRARPTPSPVDDWATNAQVLADLHDDVAFFAETYAKIVNEAWIAACASAPCPPLALPLYDGPSYVYAAMAPYFDVFCPSLRI